MEAGSRRRSSPTPSTLLQFYRAVREASRKLAAPLSDADATVQSMPDASPAKWHLAHTSWFFEAMVLQPELPGYRVFNPDFAFLFNSYYESLGERQPRPRRGMITRPSLEEICAYRDHVDAAIENLCAGAVAAQASAMVELGCHHEQQHQELLLTDILHLFAQNPLKPAYRLGARDEGERAAAATGYKRFAGGIIEMGAAPENFAFDCERPRHRVFIEPYRLADRLVTNAEWMEFIADGGYRRPLLWLSEGWAKRCAGEWMAPLYWERARRRLFHDDPVGTPAGRPVRAGRPCQLFRGRRLRALVETPAADRSRMGARRGKSDAGRQSG